MSDKIFLISGASCSGKDSVIKKLRERIDFIKPITTTTREMRPGEINGRDYYFLSEADFRNGIENDEFFEWAEEDRGKFYGVTKKEIERAKSAGKTILWKVDYKGVISIKKMLPEAVAILIASPVEILKKRISERGDNNNKGYIKERMEYNQGWLENEHFFDYKVENEQGKLDETVEKVLKIIKENEKLS